MRGHWVYFVLSMATTYCFGQTTDCDLRRNSEGIKVYVCKSPTEKLKTIRSEFMLENTSAEQLIKFIFNVEDYPNWHYNLIEAELFKKINDDEINYRSELDAPWPVENRELVLNLKVYRDSLPDHVTIAIRNILTDRPLKSGLVRVPFFSGSYRITVINETTLKIIHTMKVDPGGSVPLWMVNLALAEGPFTTYKNLKKRISEVDATKK